jgi:hypothetical protein
MPHTHPLNRTNGRSLGTFQPNCCSFGTRELGRELQGHKFGCDTEVAEQARKRRIARVCAVGGTRDVTSRKKPFHSLEIPQIQSHERRLIAFQNPRIFIDFLQSSKGYNQFNFLALP